MNLIIKNKEGVFSGQKGGSRILLWIVGIIVGVAVLGIMASIVLVSLSSAREKAKEAAFKAQVTSVIPAVILACDQRNIISKDLAPLSGVPYYDLDSTWKSLRQNCGNSGVSTFFSFLAKGTGDYIKYSANCSETGCDFQSDGQSIETSNAPTADVNSDATIIENVGMLISVPSGETPTIATVTDKEKLQGQSFFKNAVNGDKVLIYKNAGKAILYRPSENRVIDVTTAK